jgi:hypothetical protein
MEVQLLYSRVDKDRPLWMEVPQVVAFWNVVDLLKVISMTSHACFELKSLAYGAITIKFLNCFPIIFNGDILFELLLVCHPLEQFG